MTLQIKQAREIFPGRSPIVLVVEDDVLTRLAIAEHLRHCGYHVIEAGTADEAIGVLRTTDLPVDVVFSDIQMPGTLDGYGLVKWIRREGLAVRIILTSGVGQAMRSAEAASDAVCFISKPYRCAEVEQRLKELA